MGEAEPHGIALLSSKLTGAQAFQTVLGVGLGVADVTL